MILQIMAAAENTAEHDLMNIVIAIVLILMATGKKKKGPRR